MLRYCGRMWSSSQHRTAIEPVQRLVEFDRKLLVPLAVVHSSWWLQELSSGKKNGSSKHTPEAAVASRGLALQKCVQRHASSQETRLRRTAVSVFPYVGERLFRGPFEDLTRAWHRGML